MLEFAELCQPSRSGLRRFTYLSTAYVAGEHSGTFSEDDLDVGQRFRNPYERSKFEAEGIVKRWRSRMPVTVVRPSIVVGEHDSGWTPASTSSTGRCAPSRAAPTASLPARGSAPVDVVPVDYVADATFALSQAPHAVGATLHLTAGRAREQRGRTGGARQDLLQPPGTAAGRPRRSTGGCCTR